MKKTLLAIVCLGIVSTYSHANELADAHNGLVKLDVLKGNALVYTSAGAVQCEYPGRSPKETAQQLIEKGIDVMASVCGITNLVYSDVCGGATNDINLHEINAANIADAKEIGFGPVSELKKLGIKYQPVQCNR